VSRGLRGNFTPSSRVPAYSKPMSLKITPAGSAYVTSSVAVSAAMGRLEGCLARHVLSRPNRVASAIVDEPSRVTCEGCCAKRAWRASSNSALEQQLRCGAQVIVRQPLDAR
jgi:hypothetical protein